MKIVCVIGIMVWIFWTPSHAQEHGFVYLQDVIPGLEIDLRYLGSQNFMGRPVNGYLNNSGILTEKAARALSKVQEALRSKGYGLKILDAYRPQKAVDHFISWAQDPADTLRKRAYYPDVDKSSLFMLGYISKRSGHTRGSTLDLTITELQSGKEIDMGGPYDYFGEISHHAFSKLTYQQLQNRQLLKLTMEKYGFRSYAKEWWHYTLNNEPFPDTYFNFDVNKNE